MDIAAWAIKAGIVEQAGEISQLVGNYPKM